MPTELVRSAYNLPPAEVAEAPFSSLGSLRPSQGPHAFPLHPLLEQLIYADWDHPDRYVVPPGRFFLLYPMEEKFTKKWSLPAVDAAISSVNRSLSMGQVNVLVFKDPADKKLESLLKASFSIAGSATQPAAAIEVCQSLKDQFKQVIKGVPAQGEAAHELVDLPRALCFAVDVLKDSMQQMSRFAHSSVHMRRILWLKH